MNEKSVSGVHWSFWLIGAAALIWNVMGGINFVMQMNPDSLAKYPEAVRALVEGRPAWATMAFAVAVFGGALGCLLLLLRKSAAYYLFIASLLGVAVTMAHIIGTAASTSGVLIDVWMGTLMSLVVAAFLLWYSKHAESEGWIG